MARATGKKKEAKKTEVSALPASPVQAWGRGTVIALLVLVGVSAAFNFTAINWGQPSGYSWNPDSVAGARTVGQLQYIFKPWTQKYPRFHFLILKIFYQPFIDHWQKNPVTGFDRQGRRVSTPFNTERFSTLVIVSRTISAFMGIGAVVGLFFTARLLFGDWVSAFFSGMALACSMLFVLYSHLANMDVPCAFWFAWSLYWAVKAVYIGKWRHFVLLGLFSALTVCTKDPAAGFIVGVAIAVWLAMFAAARDAGQSFKKGLTCIFSLKVLAAVLVAGFVFALLSDLLTTPSAFFKRMGFWFKVGVAGYNIGFSDHWTFLKRNCVSIYYSLGWPLLAAAAASAVYCIIKFRWKSAFSIVPVVVFYIVVIARVRLNIPRYYIPGYVCFMLLVGKGFAELLRRKKLPLAVRILPIAAVYLLSGLYCIGIDLEMINDSRYSAEKWLKARVTPADTVIAMSQQAYAPRVQMLGCRSNFITARPKDEKLLQQIRPFATYLVLPEKEFSMGSAFEPQFLQKLLAGSYGYEEVARFSNKYLYPKKTVFGLAGWPVPRSKLVSPEIIVLKRKD